MKMLGVGKGVRSFTGGSTALAQVTTLILRHRKPWTTEFVCPSQHLEQFRMFSVGRENHSKVSKTTFSLTPQREGTAFHFRWNPSLLILCYIKIRSLKLCYTKFFQAWWTVDNFSFEKAEPDSMDWFTWDFSQSGRSRTTFSQEQHSSFLSWNSMSYFDIWI